VGPTAFRRRRVYPGSRRYVEDQSTKIDWPEIRSKFEKKLLEDLKAHRLYFWDVSEGGVSMYGAWLALVFHMDSTATLGQWRYSHQQMWLQIRFFNTGERSAVLRLSTAPGARALAQWNIDEQYSKFKRHSELLDAIEVIEPYFTVEGFLDAWCRDDD